MLLTMRWRRIGSNICPSAAEGRKATHGKACVFAWCNATAMTVPTDKATVNCANGDRAASVMAARMAKRRKRLFTYENVRVVRIKQLHHTLAVNAFAHYPSQLSVHTDSFAVNATQPPHEITRNQRRYGQVISTIA